MKKYIELKRTYLSFLFYDVMAWAFKVGNWRTLRKESRTYYKIIKITANN